MANEEAPTPKEKINFDEVVSFLTKLGKRVDSFKEQLETCSNTLKRNLVPR